MLRPRVTPTRAAAHTARRPGVRCRSSSSSSSAGPGALATPRPPSASPPALVSAADPTRPPPPPPAVTGPIPLLGPLDRVTLKALFFGVDDLHKELKTDVFRMDLLGMRAVQVRSPELTAALQRAPAALVAKTGPGFKRVEGWLGATLFNEDDPARHAAMREVLGAAFSPAAVRALVPLFEGVAGELVAAFGALGGGVGVGVGGGVGGGGGVGVGGDGPQQPPRQQQVDAEQLCRRATMDAIGRAAFGGYDFGAVRAALPPLPPPPQRAPGQAPQQPPPPAPENMRDILDVWDRLLRTAMLLSFNFPVPDALVPGWRDYRSSLKRLDAILDAVLADREREQQERRKKRRDQAGGADAAEGESAAAEDLLSALLRGRRERPELFSDASVRSTLHLFLFAGSDTTASLLSFLFYELSRRPDAQARCAAEARAAVARSAREQRAPPPPSSSSSSQGQTQAQQQPPQQPQQQHAYSPARVPFLTACMNETLRLYPPGTDTARRAAADLDVGGFFVPKDSLLLLNNYSLHRHERYWPRPGEWLPERWIPAEAAAAGLAPDGFPPAGSSDTFQPFGVGARACVGRLFAMLEAAVLASNVLAAYELSPGDADVALLQKFTLSSEQGVFVRARRRAAAQEDEGASSSSPSSPSSSSSSVTAR